MTFTQQTSSGPARLPSAASEKEREQQRASRVNNLQQEGASITQGHTQLSHGLSAHGHSVKPDPNSNMDPEVPPAGAIIGTCQDLEKSYSRQTSACSLRLVRPDHILQAAYYRLMTLTEAGDTDCTYVGSQLEAMVLDVKQQCLRSFTAALIYEARARSALEQQDFVAFHVCLTQLFTDVYPCEGAEGCLGEFLAYHVLYQSVHGHFGANRTLLRTMRSVTPALAANCAVVHAFQVRFQDDHVTICLKPNPGLLVSNKHPNNLPCVTHYNPWTVCRKEARSWPVCA